MKWRWDVCQTPRPCKHFVCIAGAHRVPCSRRLLPILSGCRRVGKTSETTVSEQMIWCCVQYNEFLSVRTCIFGQFVQDLPLCRQVHKGTLVRYTLPVVRFPTTGGRSVSIRCGRAGKIQIIYNMIVPGFSPAVRLHESGFSIFYRIRIFSD